MSLPLPGGFEPADWRALYSAMAAVERAWDRQDRVRGFYVRNRHACDRTATNYICQMDDPCKVGFLGMPRFHPPKKEIFAELEVARVGA